MDERVWSFITRRLDKKRKHFGRGLVCAGASFAIVAMLYAGGALQALERSTLDVRFRNANRPSAVDTSIVLATIDDGSISFARNRLKVGWPWPREYYATLVEYFNAGGARSVVFDILFSEPDFPRAHVSARKSDEQFAQAIEEGGNVALAMHLTPSDTLKNAVDSVHVRKDVLRAPIRQPSYGGALAPIASFQRGAAALGGVNVRADEDGVVRRLPLAFLIGDSLTVPSLGVAGMRADNDGGNLSSLYSDLPVGPSGSFLLYFYGPGGSDGVFEDQYISMRALIVSAAQMQLGKEPAVPPSRFEDKTIIVGGTAAGLYDRHSTPVGVADSEVEGEGDFPGMEIFATFLSNVRQDHYLRAFGTEWTYLLMLLMAGVGAFLILIRSGRIGWATTTLSGIVFMYVGGAVAAFYYLLWWVPIVAPMLSLLAGFSITAGISYAVEGRRRQEMRALFQRYVSPQVVDEVVQNPEALELGGEEREGTVFFSDIRGFTGIAEKMRPQEVVTELNEYFGIATDVVLNHRAMVDKFIGDAIMAVFGAPVPYDDHAARACLAALEMNRVLATHYDDSTARNRPSFSSRVGIHTGRIVIGNVGTERRVEYTAIGDAVNVAARLEQANKQYGTRILISHATYEQARPTIEVRELDLLRVTGKDTPIRIYEVMAPAGELSEREARVRSAFRNGLDAYRTQYWVQARRAFAEALRIDPEDGPSALYQQRVEERAGESLPARWKGIHEMNTGK